MKLANEEKDFDNGQKRLQELVLYDEQISILVERILLVTWSQKDKEADALYLTPEDSADKKINIKKVDCLRSMNDLDYLLRNNYDLEGQYFWTYYFLDGEEEEAKGKPMRKVQNLTFNKFLADLPRVSQIMIERSMRLFSSN